MLYFAYGSNLDDEDWGRFCDRNAISPDCITPICPAVLPDHELTFNVYSSTRGGGALNIREQSGSYVCGALFDVGYAGWQALDLKEGVSRRIYQRVNKFVLLPNGSSIYVATYEVFPESQSDFIEPTKLYVQAVQRGLQRFNFSDLHLTQAVNNRPFPDASIGVFTYGTLMSGESSHSKIESLQFDCFTDAAVNGLLHATKFDYPMLEITENKKSRSIAGELFYFSNLSEAIDRLDEVEGFSGFGIAHNEYDRTLLNVKLKNEESTLAWCYVAGNLSIATEEITSGSWRQYKKISLE